MPLLVLVIISGVTSVSLGILTSIIVGDIMTTIDKSTKIVPVLVLIIISGIMLVSLDILTTIILGDIMATISTSTNTTELASTLLRARNAVLTFDVYDMYKSYQF